MTTPTTWKISELLPHAGEMILLDAVIDAGEEHIICSHTVRPGDRFNDVDDGLPAWCGVELMAQCVAAWSGWQARREQQPIRLGFLLGTRQYRCDADSFPLGSELVIEAVRSFHDDHGMAKFLCRIDAPGLHAEARLTVFSPTDADAFFAATAQELIHA